MVTMVAMVLSWGSGLCLLAPAEDQRHCARCFETRAAEKDGGRCEGLRYKPRAARDARVIHAYSLFSTSSWPSHATATILFANCLPISPASLARGKNRAARGFS